MANEQNLKPITSERTRRVGVILIAQMLIRITEEIVMTKKKKAAN